MDTVLKQASQAIELPIKINTEWIVKFRENGNWKPVDFNLQEDAWSFFYSKLSEIKARFLGQPLQIQK